jgi:co-chaperonin GroES (HSP10)
MSLDMKAMAQGKRGVQGKIEAESIRPIRNRVLVHNMYFGEQKTASGLILRSDDGETRGIYPRWGQVYAKGPENKDPYEVGHWILVEHGRWTRGLNIHINGDKEPTTIRMVEAESIIGWNEEAPSNDLRIGEEMDLSGDKARPEDFTNAHGQMNQ